MITEEDVKRILAAGETIEEYPDDIPFPSRLVLGWRGKEPMHVVVADNKEQDEIIIVTVYRPGMDEWDKAFRRRIK